MRLIGKTAGVEIKFEKSLVNEPSINCYPSNSLILKLVNRDISFIQFDNDDRFDESHWIGASPMIAVKPV